jgi:hypothetical protein
VKIWTAAGGCPYAHVANESPLRRGALFIEVHLFKLGKLLKSEAIVPRFGSRDSYLAKPRQFH